MITYPKTKIDRRWNNMPMKLREALYSPVYGETVIQIAKEHHLDEHKTEILVKLISFVLYGFIHTDELAKKFTQEAKVDIKFAKEISDEINKKIFSQFKKEINETYSPIVETDTSIENIRPKEKEKKMGNITISHDEAKKEKYVNKEFIRSEFTKHPKEGEGEKETDKPFIIHKEKGESASQQKKDFSFSFDDFFDKKKEKQPPIEIETPDKDNKKTIHYSEYRTPLSYDENQSFINIPKAQKKETTEKNNLKEKKEKEETEKGKNKGNPSISGNTIDLSNLN